MIFASASCKSGFAHGRARVKAAAGAYFGGPAVRNGGESGTTHAAEGNTLPPPKTGTTNPCASVPPHPLAQISQLMHPRLGNCVDDGIRRCDLQAGSRQKAGSGLLTGMACTPVGTERWHTKPPGCAKPFATRRAICGNASADSTTVAVKQAAGCPYSGRQRIAIRFLNGPASSILGRGVCGNDLGAFATRCQHPRERIP